MSNSAWDYKKRPLHDGCRHRIPIVTPFTVLEGGGRGTDRVVKSFEKAIELANKRAPKRGRQTVRQHNSYMLKRVWVVQDKESAS
jgi:hypothetical protein